MTSRRRSRDLSPEEAALWRRVTARTRPLRGKAAPPPTPEDTANTRRERNPARAPAAPSKEPEKRRRPGDQAMDARLAARLRRGRLPIDGTLDLHGLTLDAAQDQLNRYLREAVARGNRCILVITGKGAPPPAPDERDYMPERPRPGAIRAALPDWLTEGPMAGHVLGYHPAQPKHGGPGAYYVLLRRRRK